MRPLFFVSLTNMLSRLAFPTLGAVATVCFVLFSAGSAHAQVNITIDGENVTFTYADGQGQAAVNVGDLGGGSGTGGNGGTGWVVTDAEGNEYEAGTFLGRTTGGSGSPTSEQVILASGYEGRTTGGSGSPTSEQVILGSGYEEVINILITNYGAVIEHDPDLNVDILTFPNADDPIFTFLIAILTETFDGRPLIDYFAIIELPTIGTFDAPNYRPINAPAPHRYPDDAYYKVNWGFERTLFDRLTWHTASVKKQVKVSVIDSGVRAPFQGHNGLDGANIQHIEVAPSFDQNLPHALGILTLLGDQGHDGSGVAGLMGSWTTGACNAQPAIVDQLPPQILSFSAGDVAPSSYYVARAIRESIAANVDVINLSLRLPYSVTVEEAIQAAIDAGIIVVAAGGNYANGGSLNATFPASMPGVIAVGAGRSNRQFTTLSAQNGLDIVAPGEKVVVGRTDGNWQYAAGTSFASAFVSATAAFMRAVNPNVTTADVLTALQSTADQKDKTNGVGFLNAFNAVNAVLPVDEQANLNDVVQPHGCALSNDGNIRINAGGGRVDHDGHGWSTDHRHNGGGKRNSKNGNVDELYQTERRGRSFTYDLLVPNNEMFDVKLTFAELAYHAEGQRIFNVDIEDGQGVLTDFDIFAEAGALSPVEKVFDNISVQDGRLTLAFTSTKGDAQVGAIEIMPLGRPANNRPQFAAIPETMVGETQQQTIALNATDLDGDALTFSAENLPGFASLSGNTISLTPEHGDAGVYTFTVRVADTYNHATQEATVIVTPDDTNLLLRLNAGGSEVTVNGVTWGDDAYFSTNATTGRTRDIANTAYPDIYHRVRYNATWYYDIPVPEPAKYDVRLHFAELWRNPGQRVFNVDLEGERVLENLDVAAEVGKETALVKTFEGVEVIDGELSIDFTSVSDRAMISAIEIFKTGEMIPVVDPLAGLTPIYRLNAGGDPVTTSGDDWVTDTNFYNTNSKASRSGNVRGTVDDALFTSVRYGSNWYYDLPVPDAATYTVRLHFAELWHDAGRRIFNVELEGEHILENFDIAAEVGKWQPLVKTFENVPVVDGELSLDFTSISDRASVAAIEVFATGNLIPQDDPLAGLTPLYRFNAGGDPVTTSGNDWVTDTNFYNTNSKASRSGNVRGTVDDALFTSMRYGSTWYYDIPVPEAATYTVRLGFAELWHDAGRRIFNVDLEDERVLENLDVSAEVGKWQPLVKTFENVPVVDGELSLDFTSISDRAMVSFIEVYATGNPVLLGDPNAGLTPVVKINAGSDTPTDLTDGMWDADQSFFNTGRPSFKDGNVRGTVDDALYLSHRYGGNFYYEVPVGAGEYTVRLYFTERSYQDAGRRVFNVNVEDGAAKIENLDVFAEVGKWRTLVKTFENITVTDGELSLDFASVSGNAMVSGIAIYSNGVALAVSDPTEGLTPVARLNAGGEAIAVDGVDWATDVHFGGTSRAGSKTGNVRGTTDDALLTTTRYDKDFYYDIPVPHPGTYTVRLSFAELWQTQVGRRVFSVDVEDGQAGFADLDLVQEVGAWRPLVRTFENIEVIDGELSLDFLASVSSALVSSIEVFATGETIPVIDPLATLTPVAFVNAGGEALTTNNGTEWTPDAHFGGSSKTSSNTKYPIRGTVDDLLYQTERWDKDFFYDIPVANNAVYSVRLHFTETSKNAAGQRIFGINIEDDQVDVDDIDIFAQVGRYRPLILTFNNITVRDGELSIDFLATKDRAKVSAIEVFATGATVEDPEAERFANYTPVAFLNGGGEALDLEGMSWSADAFFGSSKTGSRTNTIRGTRSDALYQSVRYNNTFFYDIAVPSAGTYAVRLHFAELWHSQAGKRIFNVNIEDQAVVENLDLTATVGKDRALIQTFENITVEDSELSIDFTSVKDRAMLAGIEIFLMEAATAPNQDNDATPIVRLNAGSEALEAGDTTWGDDQFFGAKTKTYTKTKDIRSTPHDALYQSERYGKTFTYDIPVNGEGPYIVKLHFAEVHFTAAGKRVFNVDVEDGQGTLSDFDIVAEAGAQRAIVKTFDDIVVSDSVLTLAFGASKNNAKVSAIEVFAVGDGALGDIASAAGKTAVVIGDLAQQAPELPKEFALDQNYPNPFNPTTTIAFSLPEARNVSLKVYDMLGREVANLVERNLEAGQHKFSWDASNLASGTYLYRMVAGNFTSVKTMVLVK